MKGKDELTHFKKMWTWLMAHPAHDREYYKQHVADQAEEWHNNCPLSNSKYAENCTGCQLLWDSPQGTLCTDPNAPLYKWEDAGKYQPDKRSFYASQVAMLAIHVSRQLERKIASCKLRKAAA